MKSIRKKSIAFILLLLLLGGLIAYGGRNSRSRVEKEHGIALPGSVHEIQCAGNAWRGFLDRGATALFQMAESDLPKLVGSLSIESRSGPTGTGGDPRTTGWNVWPEGSRTFVPGNAESGFRQTWKGSATPVEMLSCASPTGDWLHVEVWDVPGPDSVVRMYTDWN